MSKLPTKIQSVQNELSKLSELKNFEQTQRVILSVIKLLDDKISEDDLNLFQLFNDSDGKIRANATWFYEDQIIADRKATYKVHADNELNIDFKVYGVNKAKKQVISWATALTPNFEDEPFNSKFNIGIDFIIPRTTDRVIIVLTNNYVIRTLELKGDITATYQEILAKWTEIKDFSNKSAVHNALWESFDLQPLNKKFYAGISERFITLRQHLIKEEILDEKHSSMFANRLIGRVIFTWFLDKKGIINSDLKYFDSQSFQSDTEYYKTKLERLFFGVLNTPIEEREYKDEVTPFLNGGLFEARENDLYNQNKLSFPKNYFDDLFEFLSAYNFTTDESTSQFQQVAIDPEMLGRIFENLLAEITEETGEQARKAKGAFYTPREIVDYMCKESLREYLKTKLTEDNYRDQRLYQLIDAPDKDFQDQDHNWRRDWKPYKDAILSALDDLKVLDPACGSGAFPIGMLQLLVRVYERLEPRFDGYKAKLQIIERNIYGVDVEPMAVEIARLRTWLSIIVDEDSDSRKIKPLPNLEFKFVCANSLIDLDKSGQVALYGEDPDLENKLRDIRDAYFNTESLAKKKKLKSDYEKLVNVGEGLFGTSSEKTKQLKTYIPFDNESSASFFSPEFMFGVKNFSIVIGNPPYNEVSKPADVSFFKKEYKSVLNGHYDLYIFFIKLGISILEKDGVLNYIIPNTFLNYSQYKTLRDYIYNNTSIVICTDRISSIFESAVVDNSIILVKKNINEDNKATFLNFTLDEKGVSIGDKIEIPRKDYSSKTFSFNDLKNNKPLEPFYKNSVELGSIVDSSQGITVYAKVQGEKVDYFRDSVVDDDSKKVLRGRDIDRHKINWASRYIQYGKWLWCRRDKKFFENPKIFLRQTSDKIIAVYVEEPFYAIDSVHSLISKNVNYPLIFLSGLLNSKVVNYIYTLMTSETGKVFAQVKLTKLREIPIPNIENMPSGKMSLVEDIESKVIGIMKAKKTDENTSELEKEIDELTMDLYDLNDDEKEAVRNSIK